MKKSTNRFSTQRWDNFAASANDREDDFILADLQTVPDDTGLTITPLNHIVDDEDAIDRLLAGSDFGFDNKPARAADKSAIEPVQLIDHLANPPVTDTPIDEQNDAAFVVEPLPEEQFQAPEAETPPSGFQVDAFISDYLAVRQPEHAADSKAEPIDAAVIPESMQHKPDDGGAATEQVADNITGFIAKAPLMQREKPEFARREQATDTANDVTVLQQLKTNQAYIENQLHQLQRQASAAMRIAYASLAFSIAILASGAALYIQASEMKTNVAKLTEWIEILKEDLEATLAETPAERR